MRRMMPLMALAAAACAPGAHPADAGGPFAGSEAAAAPAYAVRGADRPGWEPGWRAVLRQGELLLDSPTSAGWYRIAATERREEGGRRIVGGEGVSLTVHAGGCRLPAHKGELPDRVRLTWDGGEFEGCGGVRRAPPPDPLGTHWELVRIDADAAPSGRSPAATFSFAPKGWVNGTQACNDSGAPIGWAGGRFVHGREGGGTTDMGCGDAAASAFGRRFWALMNRARSWRIEGDRLFIAFPDGSIAELHYLL
jgi:heat shock protein HslJ